MFTISEDHFYWRHHIIDHFTEESISYECISGVDYHFSTDNSGVTKRYIVATDYKQYPPNTTLLLPPNVNPHRMTMMNPRSSILSTPDHLLLLSLFQPRLPTAPSDGLCPERIQWMTWGQEPIPYDLACKLYYACPSIEDYTCDECKVGDDLLAVWQTVHQFLEDNHYIQ